MIAPAGSICGVCQQPIAEEQDAMQYKRSHDSAYEFAHSTCAETDMAARLKVFTVYGGRRAARALR